MADPPIGPLGSVVSQPLETRAPLSTSVWAVG